MNRELHRRQFLKTAPAVGVLAYTATARGAVASEFRGSAPPRAELWKPRRRAEGDYPIRPKLHPEVTLRDEFWAPRVRTNAEVTIPFEFRKREGTGRPLNNNVLEAALFSLQTHPDPWLRERLEERLRTMAAEEPRMGNREFELAATWYRTTGRRDLLDKAIHSAETLHADFRANDSPFSGGERDSMNCASLYRVTGDPRHLWLAKHYLDIRGREDSVGRSRHNQSHAHVLEQTEAVGHAVNGVTLMVSMLDVAMLTGEKEYFDAAHRMWHDAANRKMYVTGGVGTTGNEGFGEPWSLPNIDAYSETCAVLMFITLSHNLFLATGDSRYIDVMERGMYNNAVCGVSVSGDHYFYVNRLASAGDGRDLRWQHASLECCPPNLVRFMARMPQYIYAQDRDGAVFVNLYLSSDVTFDLEGRTLGLSVDSEMPWGGHSTLAITAPAEVEAVLKLRIPGWARNRPDPEGLYTYSDRLDRAVEVRINGAVVDVTPDRRGYVTLRRRWKDGDVIEVRLPVAVRKVLADARVRENRGRFAVERGPVVYCCEWPETPDGQVLQLLFDDSRPLRERLDPELFGGTLVVDAAARPITDPSASFHPVTLIPYSLWANRGAGEMSVWLSREEYAMGDTGPAGGFIFHENRNHAVEGWRYLEAAPFDQSGGVKWGCFRREVPGARGTAVGTGQQNTLDILAACHEPASAAYLCHHFILNGIGGWFLPSTDELVLMYRNLRAKGLGNFTDMGIPDNFTYWASSQNSADMAAHVDMPDLGRVHGDDKDFPRRVRAVREL